MSLILSTPTNPGEASWESAAGSALAQNIFGFANAGGTILATESTSIWCTTGAVTPVNIAIGVSPTFAGQTLSFFLATDGGQNVVVTFPAALNSAGNTIVTMNDANDSFVATGVASGAATFTWVITANNGCALS